MIHSIILNIVLIKILYKTYKWILFIELDQEFKKFKAIIIILNNLLFDLQIVLTKYFCRSHIIRPLFNYKKLQS